jgi:hypothetical protein
MRVEQDSPIINPSPARSEPHQLKLFRMAAIGLFAVGFIARLLPLFNQNGRLLRQWPTEDGYLMLTIARNIGLGHGMSIAGGTIPTNGTQPLFTFIQAIGFFLVGGDREDGVLIALLLQLGFSLVAAGCLFLLARQVLHQRPYHQEVSALAVGLWYASPVVIPHSMNCLETGLYTMLILITLYSWYGGELRAADRCHVSKSVVGIGVLLGLCVWARIDAVFLVAAITLWHSLIGLLFHRQQFPRRLIESVIMGSTAVILISPWLIYNKVNFGSIMPISGTAQSATASFASNLGEVPAALFEYATFILPIPYSLEHSGIGLVGASIGVLLYAGALGYTALRMKPQERLFLAVGATFALFLMGYYGLFFGAAHFVDRYLSPISPLTAILTATLLGIGWMRLRTWKKSRQFLTGVTLAIVTLVALLHLKLYRQGSVHQHFQVINWVQQNVPEVTWVGAIQTGTLGFFHDRTVNLDGKVNPAALAALLRREIPTYVVQQEFDRNGGQIDYLADWFGIASWIKLEPIASHFDLIVEDQQNNLAVLRRHS